MALHNNPVRDRHPQPRARADRFRRVERLEDPHLRLLGHPRPIVGDHQAGLPAFDTEGNVDHPSLRHRINGIEHDIQDRLLHLATIALDRHRCVRQAAIQRDPLVDRRFGEFRRIVHYRTQVQRTESGQAATRKREQSPAQVSRLVGRILDQFEALAIVFVHRRRYLQQARIAEYRRKQVVEVMRDHSRHRPKRFHLLCLQHLALNGALGRTSTVPQVRPQRLEHLPEGLPRLGGPPVTREACQHDAPGELARLPNADLCRGYKPKVCEMGRQCPCLGGSQVRIHDHPGSRCLPFQQFPWRRRVGRPAKVLRVHIHNGVGVVIAGNDCGEAGARLVGKSSRQVHAVERRNQRFEGGAPARVESGFTRHLAGFSGIGVRASWTFTADSRRGCAGRSPWRLMQNRIAPREYGVPLGQRRGLYQTDYG